MKKLYIIISIISIVIIIGVSIYIPIYRPDINETIVTGLNSAAAASTPYDASFVAQRFIDTQTSMTTNNIKYDNSTLNLDVKYHETPEEIMKNDPFPFGATIVQDQSGNLISLTNSQIKGSPLYYDPNVIRYNPQTYVPNYEDTMYLRPPFPEPAPVSVPPNKFCDTEKHNPLKIEYACQALSGEKDEFGRPKCDAHECCVNLGGSKCVMGNEHGPKYTSNYGDIFVRNRDFYYYRGKCFGNCQGEPKAPL